jgi:hypothetical protein
MATVKTICTAEKIKDKSKRKIKIYHGAHREHGEDQRKIKGKIKIHHRVHRDHGEDQRRTTEKNKKDTPQSTLRSRRRSKKNHGDK